MGCRRREQFYDYFRLEVFNLNRSKSNIIFNLVLFKPLPKGAAYELKSNRCKPALQTENEDELFEQSKN